MERNSKKPFQVMALSRPAFAWLELTYACGGKCPGCPSSDPDLKTHTMPSGRWSALISHLAAFVEEIRLTGGEPTLYPDLPDILEALHREKVPFKIFTNGQWPDSGALFRALKGISTFRGFNFSLHGSTSANHLAFTGPADFNRLLSHMKEAVAQGFTIDTSSVIGPFNYRNIPGILMLASSIGSRRHHFLRHIGPQREGISLRKEYAVPLLAGLTRIPARVFSYRVGECMPKCFFPGARPCLAGITHITITPAGQIKACPFSREILGTFTEDNVIRGKRKIRQWASDFHQGCLRCDEIGLCMGGCRVMRREFLLKRDPLMEEPLLQESRPCLPDDEKPFHMEGRLTIRCKARKEQFGYILIREGETVPITSRAHSALSLCNGTRTMNEIETITGPGGRDFLLSLYLKGFIELA